jgi:hypothetical protein
MKKFIILFTIGLFLLGCERNKDEDPQEFVFGLQLASNQLSFDYINLSNCEITNHSLPIQSGVLFRGVFDENSNYYASVADTVYEINIADNTINRKFNSPDKLLYIFNDFDRQYIIGVNIINDTVGIYRLSLQTENQSFIKTNLISDSDSFISDVVYNSNEETLIIKIGNEFNTLNIGNGERISVFEIPNATHGLRFSRIENSLNYIEFCDDKLYYKKCDLNGNENFSKILETEIVFFIADNFVLTDNNDYVFIAMNQDQITRLHRINSNEISTMEIKDYDAIFGFSYIKK